MKFAAVALASAFAAVATADLLQINTPTKGSTWTVGKSEFIAWTGDCASMGPNGKNVSIELLSGPAESVIFEAALGTLDCTNPSVNRHTLTLPEDTKSGEYSIRIQTVPVSYTNPFQINGKAAPAPSAPATTTAAEKPAPTGAASSVMAKTGAVAAAALAAAAYLF
ncbi:hypothetical protein BGW42_006597 [Actinomortierella wolfii]|nr:hypothetical protein BGW42_006597 [Actinomortierella wolfii]KAG0223020.1 hypothetical protein BGW41_005761 [Actinomortierella wolfii]